GPEGFGRRDAARAVAPARVFPWHGYCSAYGRDQEANTRKRKGDIMHKTLTLMLLGASWAVLAGCEQSDTVPEPAEGLPQNEAPSTEPDVQIGRSDTVEPGEPA